MRKAYFYATICLLKIAAITLLTGLLGLAAILPPLGENLEQGGLDLLFRLRGPRKPPSDVVIIAIDNFSAEALNLHQLRKWPRDLHARLVDVLARSGAKVIIFDLFMEDEQSSEGDQRFAAAMKGAGNVVLSQSIVSRVLQLEGSKTAPDRYVNLEQIVSPLPLFAESAVALAPFPLPRTLSKFMKCWMFKDEAGGCPTIPVVAFHVFNFDRPDYPDGMMSQDYLPSGNPGTETATSANRIDQVIRGLRDTFRNNPRLSEEIIPGKETPEDGGGGTIHHLQSLLSLYRGPDSIFLNFYGPPGTINTFSYVRALRTLENPEAKEAFDFKGKAVFIGVVDLLSLGQKDSFTTVFSKLERAEMSGVEIAATAFANLIEDAPVRQLEMEGLLAIIWGCALLFATASILLPAFSSAIIMVVAGALYFWMAESQFASHAVWFPLVVPWSIQAPTAFFAGVLWNYYEAHKDRRKLRKAFGLYIPDSVVDQVVRDLTTQKASSQMLFGAVMLSDGEQYTSLSEKLPPLELSRFMNSYYDAVFEPVKRHGGAVSDIVGDSILASWTMVAPNKEMRLKSCLAALDIMVEVEKFNYRSAPYGLKTRIGLHCGQLSIGTIGGKGHYEYRPVGDVVNTASRIESLNKQLGTRILASGDVLAETESLLVRELGDFVLAGKSKPILIYELMARREEATEQQLGLSKLFEEGLNAFREQKLSDALRAFGACLGIKEDGPASFYIDLCKKAMQNSPDAPWDGTIRLQEK